VILFASVAHYTIAGGDIAFLERAAKPKFNNPTPRPLPEAERGRKTSKTLSASGRVVRAANRVGWLELD
jgi:hypothetical protein